MPVSQASQNKSVMAYNLLHKVVDQDERLKSAYTFKLEQMIMQASRMQSKSVIESAESRSHSGFPSTRHFSVQQQMISA